MRRDLLIAACLATSVAGESLGAETVRSGVAVPGVSFERREIRAQLLPRRHTTLGAEIGAKISRLPVAEGGRFQAGQILVQFDCAVQQAQLNKAKAALAATEMVLKANQRLAELNSVGAVELETSEAEVLKARAEVAMQAAIESKCTIAAPYPGRIADLKAREQQYVAAGQSLMDILDDGSLELEYIAPSQWLAWLKPGATFRVSIDETGKQYTARVTQIGARVDPVSQSIKITAAITGRHPELIAGMSGGVLIAIPAAK